MAGIHLASCRCRGLRPRHVVVPAMRSMRLMVALTAMLFAGCSKTVVWDEEVRLLDGRVIVATQKRRCEGGDYQAPSKASCTARESWLNLRLPEFSDSEIVWHESLKPMVLNVPGGQL